MGKEEAMEGEKDVGREGGKGRKERGGEEGRRKG